MHTFRYQAHAHGGTRLLAACAEQDEQVVDGKMSVEMRRLLPTSPPAFLSSCLLVPPALQTRIYTALQQVARQWRDFNLINSRPQGEDSLCTRCLEEYGVHQFANYHPTLIALAVESGMKSISGATIKQSPTARNMKPGAIQSTEPH